MKKLSFLPVILLILLGFGAAFAMSPPFHFKDEATFADWFGPSAIEMNQIGVIHGLPDGSFGGEKDLTRAEMAVMLDRFNDHIDVKMDMKIKDYVKDYMEKNSIKNDVSSYNIYKLLRNMEKYEDDEMDYKSEIILAESGLMKSNVVPFDVNDSEAVQEDVSAILPAGYKVYNDLTATGTIKYYLNYKATESCTLGSDLTCEIDNWYGPFFASPSNE